MNYSFPRSKLSLPERVYLYFHIKKFEKRLARQKQFPGKFVISIGNIVLGGTGKTPFTEYMAKMFLQKGFKVLTVHRGYKGKFRGEILVYDGKNILSTPKVAGDEAYLLSYSFFREHRDGVKVACGKKRDKVISAFGEDSDAVILDDAFQNPSVYRNLDIVLLDTSLPPEKIKLLPAGIYREPPESLERADILLLTRINENPRYYELWKTKLAATGKPVFSSYVEWQGIEPPLENYHDGVVAVCGIGNPRSFLQLLERKNIPVVKTFIYRDHHFFSERNVKEWLGYQKPVLTTLKDWVRLLENPIFSKNRDIFHYVKIQLRIENEEELEAILLKKFYEFRQQ